MAPTMPQHVLLSLSRYAYIEFEDKSSVKAAVELDESMFRGRVIKVRMPGAEVTGAKPREGFVFLPNPLCLPGVLRPKHRLS